MRELSRPQRPSTPPRNLSDVVAETQRIAVQLRVGHPDAALMRLDLLRGHLGTLGGVAAQQSGRLPLMSQVLALLQEATLCEARRDLVALADVLEHRLLPLLQRLSAPS